MTTTTPAREESPGCRFWSSEYDRGAVSERFPGTTSTPSASASSVRSRRRRYPEPDPDREGGRSDRAPSTRNSGDAPGAEVRRGLQDDEWQRGRSLPRPYGLGSGSGYRWRRGRTGEALADGAAVVLGRRSPTAPRSYRGGARRRRRGRTDGHSRTSRRPTLPDPFVSLHGIRSPTASDTCSARSDYDLAPPMLEADRRDGAALLHERQRLPGDQRRHLRHDATDLHRRGPRRRSEGPPLRRRQHRAVRAPPLRWRRSRASRQGATRATDHAHPSAASAELGRARTSEAERRLTPCGPPSEARGRERPRLQSSTSRSASARSEEH